MDIDLPPHQWQSDRPKPREPFFGRGWPIGLAAIASIALATAFHGSAGPAWVIGAILGVVAVGVIRQIFE